eukprot:TRINITY_DN2260_c0_g1_i1.p1 TRINITY_DN2260_c0_g1~~TRINITY_DN2260_c0_g1_i1.p1  ORF type:complete len:528 (-),score=103.75 TRINITY_DN2260_c0_g1_i1:57-1640(-)
MDKKTDLMNSNIENIDETKTPYFEDEYMNDSRDYVEVTGNKLYLALYFLIPAVSSGMFGYDIGANSSVQNKGAFKDTDIPQEYNLSDIEVELLTSSSLIGALIGSFLIFYFGDWLSRKGSMVIANGLFVGGSFISSGVPGGTLGYILLIIARMLFGIGLGFSLQSAPLYISEIAPSALRGPLVSSKEVINMLGLLLGYTMGFVLNDVRYGWRWVYLFGAFPSLLSFIGSILMPHSPRWIALITIKSHNDIDEGKELARRNLENIRKTQQTAEIKSEVNKIFNLVNVELENEVPFLTAIRSDFIVKRGLVLCIVLTFFQQFTGQPSILYYASTVFQNAGLDNSFASALSSIGIGVVKLIATIIACLYVEKQGRRPLFIIGYIMMAISLIFLTIGYINDSKILSWIFIIAMLVYTSGFQIGTGPLLWTFGSEIFPTNTRSSCMSIIVFLNFLFNIIVVLTYISIQKLLGAGTYMLYFVVTIICIVFIFLYVPETKGKTLEDMATIFKTSWIVVDTNQIKTKIKSTLRLK